MDTDQAQINSACDEKIPTYSLSFALNAPYLGFLASVEKKKARLQHAPKLRPALQGASHLKGIVVQYIFALRVSWHSLLVTLNIINYLSLSDNVHRK
jgi:hypothetical protein